MEVEEHTNTSRLTEWPQEETLSHVNTQELAANYVQQSEQSKKLKHIPMSKLSLNCIFVKKEHEKNLYKQELSTENKSVHNYFYEMKENYESDIYDFLRKYDARYDAIDEIDMDNSLSEISSQYLKRQTTNEDVVKGIRKMTEGSIGSPSKSKESSKRINEGAYFWNNWRSYEDYPCIKAINKKPITEDSSTEINEVSIQGLSAHLVYAVIDMDFDRALKIIENITEMYNDQNKINRKSYESTNSIQGVKHVVEVRITNDKSSPKLQRKPTNLAEIAEANKSLRYLKENSLNLKSLRIIIKGLKNLSWIIKLTDELNNNSELSETFFNREQFHLLEDHYLNDPKAKINLLNIDADDEESKEFFKEKEEPNNQNEESYENNNNKKKFDKKPSSNLTPQSPKQERKTMKSTENLINFKNSPKKPKSIEELKSFLELKSKYQKICILNNLMFLINFSKKIRIDSCENDYFKLLFCYLSNIFLYIKENGQDQQNESSNNNESYHINSEIHKNNDDFIRLSPLLQEEMSSNISQSSIIKAFTINYKNEVDYFHLLLTLPNIQIFDRLNFAARLLSKQKKIKFVTEIHSKILRFHSIDNLLLFTKSYKEEINKSHTEVNILHYSAKDSKEIPVKVRKNSTDNAFHKWQTLPQLEKERAIKKTKVERNLEVRDVLANKIRTICQNYIDESADLATIAYLSIEFDCLEKYFECYRESLLLSFEQEEVEKLDAMKESSKSEQWTDKRTYLSKKYAPFLSQINFRQEKINEYPHEETIEMIDARRCEICSLKIFPDNRECYIECSKCRHGGHFEHIIKWYNFYQNCPNANCSCVCN